MSRNFLPLALVVAGLAVTLGADAPADPARLEFFESKVRPILAENCLGCHGPRSRRATCGSTRAPR